ncbi:MAG TPA: double-strand break repair protein AddB [Stellaceae bacterium]|nr:double-strand break repair protein AddB [Stellaceae bacterium]
MPPKLYTIAPDRPFLPALASGILAMGGGDPLYLPRVTVLLPTRRAVRALRETFLATAMPGRAEGAPLLLPRMRAVGDLDADELSLGDAEAGEEALALPPAIPELRRRLLLARLVLRWSEGALEEPLLPGQAAALAGALARFLDEAATAGADFARLADLVPANHAEHWQIVHRFLEILPGAWPKVLAAEGALDPADRRNRLLKWQAARWRASPPAEPVIAAGLMGGIPALSELVSVVGALPCGAVVLPGLDRFCEPADWAGIEADEAHPQHLLALLLKELGAAPVEVRDWPAGLPVAPAPTLPSPASGGGLGRGSRGGGSGWGSRAARMRLVAEALRPPEATHRWRELGPQGREALAGLSRFDCDTAEDEALTIALLLRQKLETPGATAALVTPDRELARRVAAELRRWGIDIDDSAGLPLNRTPPGAFLRLVAELAESRLAPVPLFAALKHPLAAGGMRPEQFRDLVRRLERAIRGPRPAPGIDGLFAALGEHGRALARLVRRIEACLGEFPALLGADNAPLAALAEAHVAAAERLAASAEESGIERLWREAAGETAARFCHELIEAAQDFPPIPGRHYPALFEALAGGAAVRPQYGRHPRLSIWGLVEARLQQPDLFVVGGLNEGTWPAATAHDPWMSRQMRSEFGLALPERTIGIAAHDFAQALGAPQVALTRAARREGAPTVPSRWLLRLDAVLRAAGLGEALAGDAAIAEAAAKLDMPRRYRPLPPAEPRPPLAARPRRLSVTQIETWMRDPYAIYARHILRLDALDMLDADPSFAELGTIVHDALDRFLRRFPHGLPAAAEAQAELLRIGEDCFGAWLSRPGVWAFWWPRFSRIAEWLVVEEGIYRRELEGSRGECRGSLVIEARGGPFTLTAKADRIDRLREGGFAIIDYKTGSLPQKWEIEASLAAQLPLEGAILRDGGFGELRGIAARLEYWRLTGREPAGERKEIGNGDPGRLVDLALGRLRRLIDAFDDPATPYLAAPAPHLKPRYSDYEHLERLDEGEDEEW